MKIIGISPLDKDSTVCLVDGNEIVFSCAEERLSRQKMHAGFPRLALAELLRLHELTANDIDVVTYAFQDWEGETLLMRNAFNAHSTMDFSSAENELLDRMRHLPDSPSTVYGIPGLDESALRITKPTVYKLAYRQLATQRPLARWFDRRRRREWLKGASLEHKRWSRELRAGLEEFQLSDKLVRVDHHLTHAANAYLTSGFDEALIVTLDGYGGGLGGSVSAGRNGHIERLHSLPYPVSFGEFYERVTSSLGFVPGRHEGKVVGLAAYESPDIIHDVVRSFFTGEGTDIRYVLPHNFTLSRHLAACYPKPVLAAAFQRVLEEMTCSYVKPFINETGISNIVLSGGVVANVKANQRVFELEGVDQLFVHPNMGDGGCSVGGALAIAAEQEGFEARRLENVYLGPEYDDASIAKVLDENDLDYRRSEDIDLEVAKLLADGNIVARFNGRMEYGPRSLGNRSILYNAKDPEVNLWLNNQLNRTEFMPFAPATLHEQRDECYINIKGAEHAASFMTITFDCTERMKQQSPAAVHIDGTARPQLVSSQSNPSFHRLLSEYFQLTGIPSIINTSFNMHEEPIVCTPADAVRAFVLGNLPYLAVGNYLVSGITANENRTSAG